MKAHSNINNQLNDLILKGKILLFYLYLPESFLNLLMIACSDLYYTFFLVSHDFIIYSSPDSLFSSFYEGHRSVCLAVGVMSPLKNNLTEDGWFLVWIREQSRCKYYWSLRSEAYVFLISSTFLLLIIRGSFVDLTKLYTVRLFFAKWVKF